MKTTFTIMLTFLTIVVNYGQITTTKVAPKVEQIKIVPYDSTENFLGKNVYAYIGQELYLIGKHKSLRDFGYTGFVKDYTKDKHNKSNVYKPNFNLNTKYDELAGKYFNVLDVMKHPKATDNELLYGDKYFLKLQEKENKDVVYFEYDSQVGPLFPFVVSGYFTKLKHIQKDKEYIIRGKDWIGSGTMTDLKSGIPVSNFTPGSTWKCVDITIEEQYYTLSLVLQNEKGEQIPLGVDNAKNPFWVFEASMAEEYKKDFGEENWQRILEGKVKIGMTKKMCELSWGKPKKINETITSGNKSEQWVYRDNYLYFENDILITIQ
jgi:hypothetical protein